MRRLILFLIRKRLGVKKYERFKFDNQKSKHNFYFFTTHNLVKADVDHHMTIMQSHVSLNWILSNNCEITRI